MNRSCWFWFQHLKNMHAMQVCFIVTSVWQYVYRWLESVLHVLARLTRRVPLVEQELLALPQHLSSLRFLIEVCVTRSLVLYVCFVDCCLSFCIFWPLCCLFFFDIRILITPLVSSSSSYEWSAGFHSVTSSI